MQQISGNLTMTAEAMQKALQQVNMNLSRTSGSHTHAEQFRATPLVAGSLIGVRAFTLAFDGQLRSPTYSYHWLPGVNEASCQPPGTGPGWPHLNEEHHAGTQGCLCGFYGYHAGGLSFWEESTPHMRPPWLGGIVEAFGTATLGSYGFRAQKAKVLALFPFRTKYDLRSPLRYVPDYLKRHYPIFGSQNAALAEFPLSPPLNRGPD